MTSWKDISARVDSLPWHCSPAHLLIVPDEIRDEMLQSIREDGGTAQFRTIQGWAQPVLHRVRATTRDESGSIMFSLELQETELIDSDQIAISLNGYEQVTEIPSYAPWWK